ncbi:STAS-like domain-containing protein [Burkholderia gladioli]|uniref:STAS-like domain-containing protein n=1 Tax=Burkholderia gladioli TaxID=28095 RepID=UPI0016431C7F|nr:STAS-like domain-containing protein [Burkholderia gladioli]
MKRIAFAPEYTDLASRRLAADLRVDVARALDHGHSVSIDLRKVESVSESYADELFGILAIGLGLNEFVKKVTILHANTHVLRVIAQALRDRLEQQNADAAREQIHQLVAAQHARRSRLAYC